MMTKFSLRVYHLRSNFKKIKSDFIYGKLNPLIIQIHYLKRKIRNSRLLEYFFD